MSAAPPTGVKVHLSRKLQWWGDKDVLSFHTPAGEVIPLPTGGFTWTIPLRSVYRNRRVVARVTMSSSRSYASRRTAIIAMQRAWDKYNEDMKS